VGDVLGSIGQPQRAEALGQQVRRTLPDIVSAVTERPAEVATAFGQGMEQEVLDKGLGAVAGLEDLILPGSKAVGMLGAAAMGLGKLPPASKAVQDIVDLSKARQTPAIVGSMRQAGDLLSDVGEDVSYAKTSDYMPGQRISTRIPKGATITEDPLVENLTIDTDVMRRDEKLTAKMGKELGRYVNITDDVAKSGDADKIIQAMKDHDKANLEFIFEQMPPEIRDRSKLWYDGANKIANEFARRYNVTMEAASGVLAALSPQMDWFKNVTLAERVIDTVQNQSTMPWTAKMERFLDKFYAAPGSSSRSDWRQDIDAIRGKTLAEIDEPLQQALWIRAFDETMRDKGYRVITPEGDFGNVVKTKKGENAASGWGAFADIAKAASVIKDPSKENISRSMGVQHKVRNFYNNIADPQSPYGDVTMDTHAIAAGLLRPLSGSSLEVKQNLGGGPSSNVLGVQGSYPVHADAYREAAADMGIQPRQMQSVTWEGIRGLYTPEQKRNKAFVSSVDNLFQQYKKGTLSLQELQQSVLQMAGGIDLPDWAKP